MTWRWRQGADATVQLVEAIEFLITPLLGSGVLQEARLYRNAHRRHGDTVLVGEIGNGLDLGIVADQVVRKVTQGRYGLDVLLPWVRSQDGQQWTDTGTGDIDGAGQQRIVDCRATGKLGSS